MQNPRCSESGGCQFEDSHLATMPLSSPKQLVGIRERESNRGYNAGEGKGGVVGGPYFSRSGDLTFGHC